jgi:hypothetical protein
MIMPAQVTGFQQPGCDARHCTAQCLNMNDAASGSVIAMDTTATPRRSAAWYATNVSAVPQPNSLHLPQTTKPCLSTNSGRQ